MKYLLLIESPKWRYKLSIYGETGCHWYARLNERDGKRVGAIVGLGDTSADALIANADKIYRDLAGRIAAANFPAKAGAPASTVAGCCQPGVCPGQSPGKGT